jgi:hypothetical protein
MEEVVNPSGECFDGAKWTIAGGMVHGTAAFPILLIIDV